MKFSSNILSALALAAYMHTVVASTAHVPMKESTPSASKVRWDATLVNTPVPKIIKSTRYMVPLAGTKVNADIPEVWRKQYEEASANEYSVTSDLREKRKKDNLNSPLLGTPSTVATVKAKSPGPDFFVPTGPANGSGSRAASVDKDSDDLGLGRTPSVSNQASAAAEIDSWMQELIGTQFTPQNKHQQPRKPYLPKSPPNTVTIEDMLKTVNEYIPPQGMSMPGAKDRRPAATQMQSRSNAKTPSSASGANRLAKMSAK